MNFRHLHYICTVANHRNISKAAKELMISQPSLSNFIAKIEEELGIRLFERSTASPLEPTYAGERFLEHARSMLMQYDSMMREMSDISGNIAGRIRLGFPHERLSYMVPIIFPKYKERYPNIELKFVTADGRTLMNYLREGRIDMAVLPYQSPDETLDAADLFEESIFLVAHKDYLKENHFQDSSRKHIYLPALGSLNFILLREGHILRRFVDAFFASVNIVPNVILETSSNLASYKLAASGLGATIVPQTTLALTRVEHEARKFRISQWTVRALYRKGVYIGPPESNLISLIKEAF